MTVRQLRRNLGRRELQAWQAYFDLEYAPDYLDNWRAAMIGFTVASAAGAKRAKFKNFMPPPPPSVRASKRKQSAAEQIMMFKSLTK